MIPDPISLPPLSPYGTFQGSLFQYHRNLVAFESTPPILGNEILPEKKMILIGGLSDGLIPTPYTSKLQSVCFDHNWSLVQPILSSSYLGFGNGSLERDTFEICQLLKYLQIHRNANKIALIGHSTGCQNSVHLLKHCNDESLLDMVKLVVLQAPVSDREGPMSEPDYESNMEIAQSYMNKGKGEEMMPRSAFWAPITASRFIDLQGKNGEDDFFSSDFTDFEFAERLSHVGMHQHRGLHLIAAYSGMDEYVPEYVDKDLLLQRMCDAMNSKCDNSQEPVAHPLMLETGNHNLSSKQEDMKKFIDEVGRNLARI